MTSDRPARPAAGSRRGYFVPGLIALLALVGLGAAFNIGGLDHQRPSRLDGAQVASTVAQGLQAQRRLPSPPSITCPPSEPVRAGLRFSCRWQEPRGTRTVQVTELGDRGQFRFTVSG